MGVQSLQINLIALQPKSHESELSSKKSHNLNHKSTRQIKISSTVRL